MIRPRMKLNILIDFLIMIEWVKQYTFSSLNIRQTKQVRGLMNSPLYLFNHVLYIYCWIIPDIFGHILFHLPICHERLIYGRKYPGSILFTTCVKDISDMYIDPKNIIAKQHGSLQIRIPFSREATYWDRGNSNWLRPCSHEDLILLKNRTMGFKGSGGTFTTEYTTSFWIYPLFTIHITCHC